MPYSNQWGTALTLADVTPSAGEQIGNLGQMLNIQDATAQQGAKGMAGGGGPQGVQNFYAQKIQQEQAASQQAAKQGQMKMALDAFTSIQSAVKDGSMKADKANEMFKGAMEFTGIDLSKSGVDITFNDKGAFYSGPVSEKTFMLVNGQKTPFTGKGIVEHAHVVEIGPQGTTLEMDDKSTFKSDKEYAPQHVSALLPGDKKGRYGLYDPTTKDFLKDKNGEYLIAPPPMSTVPMYGAPVPTQGGGYVVPPVRNASSKELTGPGGTPVQAPSAKTGNETAYINRADAALKATGNQNPTEEQKAQWLRDNPLKPTKNSANFFDQVKKATEERTKAKEPTPQAGHPDYKTWFKAARAANPKSVSDADLKAIYMRDHAEVKK